MSLKHNVLNVHIRYDVVQPDKSVKDVASYEATVTDSDIYTGQHQIPNTEIAIPQATLDAIKTLVVGDSTNKAATVFVGVKK
jgi:hypothetical protein